jgi:hypothetical protein
MEYCTATQFPKICMSKNIAKKKAKEYGYRHYKCKACGKYHLSKWQEIPGETKCKPL